MKINSELDVKTNKIINVGTPSADGDAVNKEYLDARLAVLGDIDGGSATSTYEASIDGGAA